MHLGRYLLEKKVVTPDQLEEALQLQVACGGRLGTNLVELGHLSVAELGRHISEHAGLPLPPSDWVESPQAEALKAVPLELVRKYKILPLRLENRTLHVAMLDPLDPPQMDELAFAVGHRLRPYVLPEVAVVFWLDKHLGVPREIRHVDIGDGAPSAREPSKPSRDRARRDPNSPAVQAMAALGVRPLGVDEELVDEGSFAAMHTALFDSRQRPLPPEPAAGPTAQAPAEAGARPAAPRPRPYAVQEEPPAPARAVSELEARLAGAADRDAVAEAVLELACAFVPAAALFVVHRGMIAGVRARGGRIDRRIRALMIPEDAESFLSIAAATAETVRGAPPPKGIDARLLEAMDRSDARQMAVLPVRIRKRVVNLLYVDHGPDPIAESTLAALEVVCRCASVAYERLILERKRHIEPEAKR